MRNRCIVLSRIVSHGSCGRFLFSFGHGTFHGNDPSAKAKEHFRILEMLFVFLHHVRRQIAEILFPQANHQELSCHHVIDFTGFIPQGAVQRQTVDLSFLIDNYSYRIVKGIYCFDISANRLL